MTNWMERLLHGDGEHADGAAVAVTVPGRLHFDADGKLRGPADISYNDPFPCVNGAWGSGAMDGVLMHTMVANLPSAVAWFNAGASQVSAHFGIAQSGEIWQWGPVGKGWVAWHAEAANLTYYGMEHADAGNPDTPLTVAQIAASAQVLEALSAFAGFPLQEANAPGEKGYGTHAMGGASYGGHSCPDLPPEHVRSRQRPAIISLAKAIRAQGGSTEYVTTGTESLAEVAKVYKVGISYIVRLTLQADGTFPAAMADYLDAGNLLAVMPKGITVRVPASS
jgi:hypothetical protein